jgi:outer membrane protein assembly factor BamB/adenine/guanine phosphoribosyltransferase-like PRPP-binding protein
MNLKEAILNEATIYNGPGNYLFDLRQLLLNGDYLYEITAKLWKLIDSYKPDIIIGYGYGGALLVPPLRLFSNIPGLVVREERREGNTRVLIEGFKPTDKIYKAVFVDDNINSGSTVTKCLDALDKEGYESNVSLVGIVTITDFKEQRIQAKSLFTRHQLGLTRAPLGATEFSGKLRWHLYNLNKYSDYVCSPPSIAGNRVYVGTNKNEILAVDIKTGDILWKGAGEPCVKGIASRPLVTYNNVTVSSYDGYLTKYTPDGDSVWSKKLDNYLHSSPIYVGKHNAVYLGTENKDQGDIVAVDFETGETIWRVFTNHYVPCSPAYDVKKDLIICGSNDYHLYWIEAATGKLLARSNAKSEIKGFVQVVDDKVITGTQNGFIQLWKDAELLNERNLGQSLFHSEPIFYDDLVIVGNTQGLIFGIEIETLKIRWVAQTHGGVSYGLTRLDSRILCTSKGRIWSIIDANTGTKLELEHKMPRCSQPADYNGIVLVVATDYEGLLCIEL